MGDKEKSESPQAKSPVGSPGKAPSPAAQASSLPAASSPPPAIDETAPLDVDENPYEDDLGFGVGAESDTTSIKSSILRYREENGRTYHSFKDGAYMVPNDDDENDRLDLQHTIWLLTLDSKLYLAPIKKEAPRVLDVGCGTGIWSIEFADENPDAHVTGTDLSPIQPAFIPPNVRFLIEDAEDDWEFSTPFDFIFARVLTGAISDFPRLFRQSFTNLEPGGWIELQDTMYPVACDDDTLTEESAVKQWSMLAHEAFRRNGRPLDTVLHYEQQLADAGFVNIHVVHQKWPINRWPKNHKYKQLGKIHPGIWTLENALAGLNAVSLASFTRPVEENGLGWSREEVEVMLVDVRRDLKNTNIHAYLPIWIVYAQKPE